MTLVTLHKRLLTIVALCPVLLFLIVWTSVSQADGEEPFVGVIKKIDENMITVEVTKQCDSLREMGDEVMLLITRGTITRDNSMKIISSKRLRVGLTVRVQPNTLSNRDVEASILIVENRRERQ
ncbi:MAG: hypothetical protein JRF28_04770 [Deltaproteobacteria bacterium]|nr:hypothetical protein [Deltaproteobacteria bacterium]